VDLYAFGREDNPDASTDESADSGPFATCYCAGDRSDAGAAAVTRASAALT
jgi:hypothetical protein